MDFEHSARNCNSGDQGGRGGQCAGGVTLNTVTETVTGREGRTVCWWCDFEHSDRNCNREGGEDSVLVV